MANPFDALDGEEDVLEAGPPPTLMERFLINFSSGYYENTVLGAAKEATDVWRAKQRRGGYDAYPEWQSWSEGVAALGGQIAGTAASPENFLGVGLGFKLLAATGKGVTGLAARVFAGAVDGAATNAVADVAIQGIEMQAGLRDEFDPERYAIGVLLGGGIGGAGGAGARGIEVWRERKAGAAGERVKTDPDNPFDALDEPGQASPAKPEAAELAKAAEAAPDPAAVNMAAAEAMTPEAAGERAAVEPAARAVDVADAAPPVVAREAAAPETIGERLSAEAAERRGIVEPAREAPPARPAEDAPASPPRAEGAAPAPQAARTSEADEVLAMATDRARAGEAAASKAEASAKAVDEFLNLDLRPGLTQALARDAAGVAGQAAERIARVRETAEALARTLGVHATRQGRIRGRKEVLGTYGTRTGVVRVRSLEDFDVLTHEYGHHLDAHIPEVKAFIKRHSAVFRKLDYDPMAGRDFEGFAEFFRLWLTNRAFLETNMPILSGEFRKLLDTRPELRDGIDAAAAAWSDFLNAPSTAAVGSTIVSSKKGGWFATAAKELREGGIGGTISEVLSRIYTFAFDDFNPINRAVRHLEELHFANTGKRLSLKTAANPYKLARMSRGAYSAGHMDVMYGVAPYRGLNPETPSLRDAIVEAMGSPNGLSKWNDAKAAEFGSYLWSRRALGEWERFERGEIPNPPDKLTKGDHQVNVRELEAANPQFASAADKVHRWALGLWKKKRDAGLITDEDYEAGLKIRDYVPGLRDFSADTDVKVSGRQQGRGGTTKGGLVKRFRGSKRDVINPLETLAADAYETAMTIARNDVVKAIDRLAMTAGKGGGAIAERIPVRQMKATMVDPIEAVEAAARNAGLSKPDITVLRDALESAIGDEKAAIFRPAMINEKGEPIVFFRDGGELVALRLADGRFGRELYGALTLMSKVEKNFWLELVAMPARVLRAGITTAPEFIIANFIRDQAMAWIFYGNPMKRVSATFSGAVDDVFGRKAAQAYARVGGISGGQEVASLGAAQVKRDLSILRRKGWTAQRLTSVRGLLTITETSETATRLGLFRTFTQEARARGLSDYEAALEAAWRARDYIDFDRRGSGMAALARVIPFLNVSLQGIDKARRHMLVPLAKKMLGKPMSANDEAGLADAVRSWSRLAMLAAASLPLYALQSEHEDHDEISTLTRATHWTIKVGEKWIAIPKPFEMAVLVNLVEAAYDAIALQDPTAAKRFGDSIFMTMMPPSVTEGNPAVKSYFEVKTNKNLFTDAPIVPEALSGMEPWMQYTARTSQIGRQIGAWFDVSPMVVDHLIVSHLGSWGRGLTALYDMAQPDAPTPGWDDAPITRRFIKDASKGAQSVTRFWELAGEREGELEGKWRSYKFFAESDDQAGAAEYFAGLKETEKVYVTMATMEAKYRRLHPIVRARGAIQAIGAVRREIAAGYVASPEGGREPVASADRTAIDDILSSLSMAIARNGLIAAGERGWSQKDEIDEYGFYRELEAVSPRVLQRLADGFATKEVGDWNAVRAAWPEVRARVTEERSDAILDDLLGDVRAAGPALEGGLKFKRKERPQVPSGL